MNNHRRARIVSCRHRRRRRMPHRLPCPQSRRQLPLSRQPKPPSAAGNRMIALRVALANLQPHHQRGHMQSRDGEIGHVKSIHHIMNEIHHQSRMRHMQIGCVPIKSQIGQHSNAIPEFGGRYWIGGTSTTMRGRSSSRWRNTPIKVTKKPMS